MVIIAGISLLVSVSEIPFEERCIYTASETSAYLSIVRVYFVTTTGRTDADSLLPYRLTYRTFTPNQTVLGSTSSPPEFEDTRNLCDRVNQWLHITGMDRIDPQIVSVTVNVINLWNISTKANEIIM